VHAVTAGVWLLIVVFLAVAALDWAAVHTRSKALEYVCKPGCMLVLIAAAAALDGPDDGTRTALVAALALSAIGDVFLMVRGDSSNLFVAGLGSFLLAHVAYVVAFWLDGVEPGGVGAGLALAVVLVTAVGRPVVAAVRHGEEPQLAGPVTAYVGVISLMLLSAAGTLDPVAIAGAVLFAGSDALIARTRFVREAAWAPLAIIVSYHLAQALLVVSFG
jgi:uncharacterized membrane protein YhhN